VAALMRIILLIVLGVAAFRRRTFYDFFEWRIWLYLPFIALLAFAIGGVYLYDQIGEAIGPLAIAALAGLAILYVKTR
jgi:hypothetical protein